MDNYKRRDKKEKLLNDLKRILNSHKEKKPTNKGWTKINNITVKKADLRYEIDRRLLSQMDKYTEKYINIPDADMHDVGKSDFKNFAIVYYANSLEADEFFVGYTHSFLNKFIKINIHKYNLGEKNVFENFEETEDLVNIIFVGLEYVKYNYLDDLEDRVNELKTKIMNMRETTDLQGVQNKESKVNKNQKQTKNQSGGVLSNTAEHQKEKVPETKEEKIFQKRMEFIDEVLSKSMHHFKPFDGYIYQLKNMENGRSFIGGNEKDIDKKTFLKKLQGLENIDLLNDFKKFGDKQFEFKKLEKYTAKTPYHLTLRIDFLKKINSSVYGGYNLGYGLEYSDKLFQEKLFTRDKNYIQRDMFLKLQKHLFSKNFKDKTDYKGLFGFVYKIENKSNKRKFFGSNFNSTLKDTVLDMYDKAIGGNVKHNKLLKEFMEEPYDSFIFEVVKTKSLDDTKIDLGDEVEALITKYNTIETGYNIDMSLLKRNIMFSKISNR